MIKYSILIWDIVKQFNRIVELRKPLHRTPYKALFKEYNHRIDLIYKELDSIDILLFKIPGGASFPDVHKKAQAAYLYLKKNNL